MQQVGIYAQGEAASPGYIGYIAVGVLVLVALVVVCFVKPAIARTLARIFSVLAIGGGIGILVWGIVAEASGELPVIESISNSIVIGSGAGLFAAGIVALVLSFLRTDKNSASQ